MKTDKTDIPKQIDIDYWESVTKNNIDKFVQYWKAKQNKGDVNYPKYLGCGDWDEQFQLFSETS